MIIAKKKRNGFTLVELLVVIAIIGLLAGIVIVSMADVRKKARDAKRQADITNVITAQQMVINDDAEYFNAASQAVIPLIENVAGTDYLQSSKDPTNSGSYKYLWVNNAGDKQKFCVLARMEMAGSCAGTTPNRYFIASESGTKEDCAAADYGAVPTYPTLAECTSLNLP